MRVVVNDHHQAEPGTVERRIRDKINASEVVLTRLLKLWLPFQYGFIAAQTLKPMLTVEPVNALMIIAPAFPFQQVMPPAVTLVNTAFGDLL